MAITHVDNLTTDPPEQLEDHHRSKLREFLLEDVDANLFALAWLENNGVEPDRSGHFSYHGWFDDHRNLEAISLNVSNRLIMLDTRDQSYARAFGRFFRRRRTRFQHVVSRQRSVSPFWQAYSEPDGDFHVQARLTQDQVLYRLFPSQFRAPSGRQSAVRRGRKSELDSIFLASVRMHREETREDPLARNGSSFRRHVRHRVEKGRTFVWFDDRRRLLFKADISTQCSLGAQISGVYTAPQFRGQGIATRAMTDICRILFDEDLPRLTLYVNHSNAPARSVYERIDFEAVAPYQTVFVAD